MLDFKQWLEDTGEITSAPTNPERRGFEHLASKYMAGRMKQKVSPTDPHPDRLYGKMKKKMKSNSK